MKTYRSLTLLTMTLIGAGYVAIPTALNAAKGNPDSPDVTALFTEAKAVAVRLKLDSSEMDSFSRSKLSWQSFAAKLEVIKGHINKSGELLAKMKASESAGSPWQQATIRRVEPVLQEMADNLTATINHLNSNTGKVHFPPFTDYVKTNYALSIDLETMLRNAVEYGNDKAKFERLSSE